MALPTPTNSNWDSSLFDDFGSGWDVMTTVYQIIPTIKRFEVVSSNAFTRTENGRFEVIAPGPFVRRDD